MECIGMEWQSKLQEIGITLTKSGKQICPQCSATRKNKTDKCLSVTFDKEAVLYNCHHCDWHGAIYYRSKFENTKKFVRPNPPKVLTEKDKLYRYFEKRKISKPVSTSISSSSELKDPKLMKFGDYEKISQKKYDENYIINLRN